MASGFNDENSGGIATVTLLAKDTNETQKGRVSDVGPGHAPTLHSCRMS